MPRPLTPQEMAAIEDEVVKKAPAGLSDDDFDRFFQSRFAEAAAIAENTPAPLQGSGMSRALSGLWKNINPVTLGEGIVNTVRHPIDTAMNIAQGSVDQFQKMQDAPTLSEKIGHGMGMIPVIGPAAAAAGERGASGDWQGAIGEGLGLTAPFGAVAAAKTGLRGAAAVAKRLPGAATVADAAETASTERLGKFMSPQVGPNKTRLGNQAIDVAPQLAREEGLGAVSRGTFGEKIGTKLEEAAGQMDEAADARLASQQVKTGPLLAKLDAEIAAKVAEPVEASKVTPTTTNPNTAGSSAPYPGRPKGEPFGESVVPAPNSAEVATLQKIRQEVAALGETAPYESIRRIRQAWDQVAKVKYMPATAQDALRAMGDETGAMKGAGALREALAATDQTSAAAYQRWSLFKKAQEVVKAAEEADRVRPNRGRGIMARTAGAVIGASSGGPIGAGIGAAVASIVDRAAEFAPSMQVMVARRLAGVADALRRGDPAAAQAILERVERQVRPVRTGAKLASQMKGGDVYLSISGDTRGTPTAQSEQR